MGENSIVLKNVSKTYDGKEHVIENMNLSIKKGERLILLGPSGCGKSTLLRIIAGLESVSSGELIINDVIANDIEPQYRGVSMVFQNYALYPHMTVKENIGYGLKVKKTSKEMIDKKSREVMEILRLDGLEDRLPKDLSGGQRQRVAVARALVKNSDLLLLDEPLSNLDAQLRIHSRQELVDLHNKYGMTMIYVTHDQVEAMTVGQRIVLLKDGEIQMIGTPSEVYHRPANVFTAKFIGTPPMNIIPAKYKDGWLHVNNSGTSYPLNERLREIVEKNGNEDVYIGIRPEKIKILGEATDKTLDIKVEYIEDYGGSVSVFFKIADKMFNVVTDSTELKEGDVAHLHIPGKHSVLFDGSSGDNIMGDLYDVEQS